MLYDPKWDKEIKADPFSLESLIAWLEMMPAGERYCYDDTGKCLLGQYLKAKGLSEYCLGNVSLAIGSIVGNVIDLRKNGFMATAMPLPHTFGAALERARALR